MWSLYFSMHDFLLHSKFLPVQIKITLFNKVTGTGNCSPFFVVRDYEGFKRQPCVSISAGPTLCSVTTQFVSGATKVQNINIVVLHV